MSAFMVSYGTIDRVVSSIIEFNSTAKSDTIVMDENGPHAPECRCVGCRRDINPDKLGRKLIDLNMEALRQRYGDEPCEVMYHHRAHTDEHRVIALLKACNCLSYQCSEGNVPKAGLYKLLAARHLGILAKQVEQHKTYDALPWDFAD